MKPSKEKKKLEKNATEEASEKKVPENEENLEELRKKAAERDEFYERLQRATADYQNLRKRQFKDIASRSEEMVLGFVQEILVVLDNFDFALQSADESQANSFVEGVRMIRSELEALLLRQGIEEIKVEGETFDPRLHEAVVQEEREDLKPGTVVAALRKGYRWKDRVIRPAQVTVSSAKKDSPIPPAEKPEEQE